MPAKFTICASVTTNPGVRYSSPIRTSPSRSRALMTCHFEKMKEESCGVYSLSKTLDVEATVNVYSIASTESERSDRESSNRAPNIFRFAPSRHRRESVGDTFVVVSGGEKGRAAGRERVCKSG